MIFILYLDRWQEEEEEEGEGWGSVLGLVGEVRELVKAVIVDRIVDELVLARRSWQSQNQTSPSVYTSV